MLLLLLLLLLRYCVLIESLLFPIKEMISLSLSLLLLLLTPFIPIFEFLLVEFDPPVCTLFDEFVPSVARGNKLK